MPEFFDIYLVIYQMSPGPGGPLALTVIALFLVSYRYLFHWRDFYTALRIAVVAWLVAGIKASFVIVDFYRLPFHDIGSSYSDYVVKSDGVIAIVRIIAVQMVLLVPAFLSVPLVWFYFRHRRKMRLRFDKWLFLAISVVFLDLLLHLLVFIPLWMFFLRATG